MRVSFNGDLLEVSAVLPDAASVDRLVKALEPLVASAECQRNGPSAEANPAEAVLIVPTYFRRCHPFVHGAAR
jgi:hypothetical protein